MTPTLKASGGRQVNNHRFIWLQSLDRSHGAPSGPHDQDRGHLRGSTSGQVHTPPWSRDERSQTADATRDVCPLNPVCMAPRRQVSRRIPAPPALSSASPWPSHQTAPSWHILCGSSCRALGQCQGESVIVSPAVYPRFLEIAELSLRTFVLCAYSTFGHHPHH